MTSPVLSTFNDGVVKGIRTCVDLNESVLLIGETGLGKTTLINELAKEKGKTLHRVSVNGSTSAEEILGKMGAKSGSTFWQDGILIDAMKKGDWIVMDEINAALPEVLFALHSLLDDDRKVTLVENNGEIVKPHADFRFFASMNPSDDYAGTKDMNMALMSRFAGVFFIEVYPPDVEVSILMYHKIDEKTAKGLVSVAKVLRDLKQAGNIFYFCSTRDIIQAGKLHTAGLEYTLAVRCAVVNKMSKEDREEIASNAEVGKFISKIEPYISAREKQLEEDLKKFSKDFNDLKKEADNLAQQIKDAGIKTPEEHLAEMGYEFDKKTAEALVALKVIKKKTK